jgi:hypothetical protein
VAWEGEWYEYYWLACADKVRMVLSWLFVWKANQGDMEHEANNVWCSSVFDSMHGGRYECGRGRGGD